EEGGLRVVEDVAHPFERHVLPLRLFVDGDIERVLARRIAHRHEVRRALLVGGGEVPDAAMVEKTALAFAKHAPSLRQSRAGCLALCRDRTMSLVSRGENDE